MHRRTINVWIEHISFISDTRGKRIAEVFF